MFWKINESVVTPSLCYNKQFSQQCVCLFLDQMQCVVVTELFIVSICVFFLCLFQVFSVLFSQLEIFFAAYSTCLRWRPEFLNSW